MSVDSVKSCCRPSITKRNPTAYPSLLTAVAHSRSAARGVPVRRGVACLGEIGLTGRLRPVAQLERRLAECEKLGLGEAIVPEGAGPHGRMRTSAADTLRRAIETGLDAGGPSEG